MVEPLRRFSILGALMKPFWCVGCAVFVGRVLFGCSPPPAEPAAPLVTAEASVATTTERLPAGPSAAASAVETSPPMADPPPAVTAVLESRFLPLDTKCSVDADCAVTQRGADERFFCCDACSAVAGTKAWVARADLRCKVYDKERTQHVCPPRSCGPPRGALCNHGACEPVL